MTGCTPYIDSSWSISDFADLANIIIAVFSLVLAYYIFFYQRKKDNDDKLTFAQRERESKIEAINLQEQNIRLQWFKELIIQPHLAEINTFYSNLHSIENKLTPKSISDDQKIEIIDFIKFEQSRLRKTFGDILINVNPLLYNDLKTNLDKLVDLITVKIFDESLNLHEKANFEKHVGALISYSHNDLIGKIYNYRGD